MKEQGKTLTRKDFLKVLGGLGIAGWVATQTSCFNYLKWKGPESEPSGPTLPTPNPTPEPKPIPTPEPTTTPVSETKPAPENALGYIVKELKKGEFWEAQPGDVARGDLEVNGQILYDQLAETGVITRLPNGGRVTAAVNHGSVVHFLPGANAEALIEQFRLKMLTDNPQIRTVSIKSFPDTQTETISSIPTGFIYKHLEVGKFWEAQPGDIVKGDLVVNDQRTHDQKADTGVITILTNGGRVTAAENAGDVIHPLPGSDRNAVIAQLKQNMLANNPQMRVDIQTFPGVLQGQNAEPIQQVQVNENPIQNPGRPFSLDRNQSILVPRFSVAQGDIFVNNTRLFDDDQATGAIALTLDEELVQTPNTNGASGTIGLNNENEMEAEAIRLARITFRARHDITSITFFTMRNGQIVSRRTFGRDL